MDINAERLLTIMKVHSDQDMPIYMEVALTIFRDINPFSVPGFRKELAKRKLLSTNQTMLNLRLALLESCLEDGNESNSVTTYFKPGHLTIIDLSSPMTEPSSACGFFDIILGMFLDQWVDTGKLIVLDEAHKYLGNAGSQRRFTGSLLATVRQQRHMNCRVVISTQEPTIVPPSFLELSSFILAHRFSSLKWLHHLSHHISATHATQEDLFSKIICLETGQGIIFAPSSLVVKPKLQPSRSHLTTRGAAGELGVLGQRYLHVLARERITLDGGKSQLATSEKTKKADQPKEASNKGTVALASLAASKKNKKGTKTAKKRKVDQQFAPLLQALQQARKAGNEEISMGGVAEKVRQISQAAYKKGKFRAYVDAARDAGLVSYIKRDKEYWVRLKDNN
ncbi:hypothetical protein AX16_010865 [Volvariella volvacea WC 439]|nr:hypothetical protein AX16_010865 [Volvariella volvacea WC 439]